MAGVGDLQILAQKMYRPGLRCEICDSGLTLHNIRLREKCSYDFSKKTIEFLCYSRVCKRCYDGAHIASLIRRHKMGSRDNDCTKDYILEVIEHAFKIADSIKGDNRVLLYSDYLVCLTCKDISWPVRDLIKKYHVGFYGWQNTGKAKHWRLLSKYGIFYYEKNSYQNHLAWMRAIGLDGIDNKDDYQINKEIRVDFNQITAKKVIKPGNNAFGGNSSGNLNRSAIDIKDDLNNLRTKRRNDPNVFDRQAMK